MEIAAFHRSEKDSLSDIFMYHLSFFLKDLIRRNSDTTHFFETQYSTDI